LKRGGVFCVINNSVQTLQNLLKATREDGKSGRGNGEIRKGKQELEEEDHGERWRKKENSKEDKVNKRTDRGRFGGQSDRTETRPRK